MLSAPVRALSRHRYPARFAIVRFAVMRSTRRGSWQVSLDNPNEFLD